jgi:type VI secretion system protein
MSLPLLTKLARAADPNSNHRSSYRDHDIESAISTHLVQMLNTRQGSCLTCPDYGLMEVSEILHDFPDAVGLVQRSLKASIQQYEPRLKNVQVRHVKREDVHDLALHFEISGQFLYPDGRKGTLRLATGIDASGNVQME